MATTDQHVDNFFGVDFHVHTPASSCYKGDKSDGEYLNILRKYKDKNIRIIAITDHNSINGYKKFLEIKSSIEHKLKVLEPLLEKHPELNIEVDNTKEELCLFTDILILPGLEIEVKPGIHILLIFNNKAEIKIIEELLISAGYNEAVQGQEDAAGVGNYDVLDLFTRANELSAIIIAAHADSNKGIYNDLSGKYRAAIIRANELNGICYNSVKTKDKIQLLLNNKDYKRTEPVALIQASDFHGGEDEAGKNITYLKLKEVTFEQTVVALKNPNECVSPTEHPDNINIINQVLLDPNTFTYETYTAPKDFESIVKIACAILNSGYGSLVIGVTESKSNIIGIGKQNYEDRPLYDLISNAILPEFPMYDMSVNSYPFGDKVVIAIKLSNSNYDIFYPSGDATMYITDKNNIVVATPEMILKHAEMRIVDKFAEYQARINKKINALMSEASLLTNSVEQFKIIMEVEKGAYKFQKLYNLKLVKPTSKLFDIDLGNGESSGDTVFVLCKYGPRLSYGNLRCSAPKTSKVSIVESEAIIMGAQSIIIVPGGGAFITDNISDYGILNLVKTDPALALTLKIQDDMNINKLVLSWLKSSLFIWYSTTYLGDINTHKPNIFNNVYIPLNRLKKYQHQLVQVIDTIIGCEYDFLDDFNLSTHNKEEYDEIVHQYNKKMDYHYNQIDEIVNKAFNLSDNQIDIVESFHKIKKIHFSKKVNP